MNYKVKPWVQAEYDEAKNHRWYMSALLITLNDLYSFDPNVTTLKSTSSKMWLVEISSSQRRTWFDGHQWPHVAHDDLA
ncbi:MAG: hypothetical protein CM1200mP40_25190 [Gammaproteobacteria bacterium]|nr:MAG: hypothetical protein CM1200mP40_25190 [Gammaproteobacteria bacterium]